MAIVPNGRMRTQEKQSLLRNGLFSFAQAQQEKPQQQPKTDPRLNIEQQQVGNGGQQPVGQGPQAAPAPAAPAAGPSPDDAVDPAAQANMPQDGSEMAMDESLGGEGEGDAIEKKKHQMESVFFGIVEKHFGVNPEKEMMSQALRNRGVSGGTDGVKHQIEEKLKSLFDVDIHDPLGQPTMKGFFVIPKSKGEEQWDYTETVKCAHEFSRRYGLHCTSVSKVPAGWKYEFQSQQVQQNSDIQTGTSYDAAFSGGGGNGSKKAASVSVGTIGELIKGRRDDLFNTMRKIAQGSK